MPNTIRDLLKKRNALLQEIEAQKADVRSLEQAIEVFKKPAGVAAPLAPGKRSRRGGPTILDAALVVLRKAGKPLTVGELVSQIRASGVGFVEKSISNTLYRVASKGRLARGTGGTFMIPGKGKTAKARRAGRAAKTTR